MDRMDYWPSCHTEEPEEADDLPLPGLLQREPRKELTFGERWELAQAAERKPFQPMWEEVLRRVVAHEFPSLKALGAAYGKSPGWATRLRDLAIGQRVFTAERWRACLRGKATATAHASITARPTGTGRRSLSREDFVPVFRSKQECLTFDFVVQLLRLRTWKRVEDFAAHFNQSTRWAQAFRRLLLRELVMTSQEWKACWSLGRRGRR